LLKSGRKIRYSKLLIATGGKPFIPEALEKELASARKSVFTFTKLEDAYKIKDFAVSLKTKNKNALIIGGGMIGIKAAGALKHLGYKVTIVELSDRLLGAVFDKDASDIAVKHLRAGGVEVALSETVSKLTCRGGYVRRILLKSGKEIPADIIIAAIGVVPDLTLVKGTPVKTGRGIIVDKRMKTSVKDVYAAGDVIESLDTISGENRNMAIWPLAYRQGRVAGRNMAVADKEYEGGFMMNSVDVLGLPVITIGDSASQGEGLEVISEKNTAMDSYKKIILKDNMIIGAIFIKDIDRAGIITGLMKDGVDVSSFKNDILGEKFGYIYVPKEYRSQKVAPLEI
jgi:NAD(P)H-nitrite reductase large subunit